MNRPYTAQSPYSLTPTERIRSHPEAGATAARQRPRGALRRPGHRRASRRIPARHDDSTTTTPSRTTTTTTRRLRRRRSPHRPPLDVDRRRRGRDPVRRRHHREPDPRRRRQRFGVGDDRVTGTDHQRRPGTVVGAPRGGTGGTVPACRDGHHGQPDTDPDGRGADAAARGSRCCPPRRPPRLPRRPPGTVTYRITGNRQLIDLVTVIYTDQQGALHDRRERRAALVEDGRAEPGRDAELGDRDQRRAVSSTAASSTPTAR